MARVSLSSDQVRRRLAGRRTSNPHPSWSEEDGKQTAVVALVISTPVQPDTDPEQVIRVLEGNAQQVVHRTQTIRALTNQGWVLSQPEPFTGPDGYTDIFLTFRKRFVSDRAAIDDAKRCGAVEDQDDWSFGWNEVDGEVEWEDVL